jgi:hypothetical protein
MQPMIVTVGPLEAADADSVCTSQTAPGGFGLAINGAYASGFDADAIATAQAVAGAGALTLDGVNANSGVAYLGDPSYVTITSAGNDTGITFTVAGLVYGPGGYGGSYQSEVVTGANASVVVTTKKFSTITSVTASNAAAGNVSVGVNGVATLDTPRRLLITDGGNDSGITFTVVGTDWNGHPITEIITGSNGTTVESTLDFATVESVILSGASALTVQVGTDGVASSRPVFCDNFNFAPMSLQVVVDGTVNYTVRQSLDDPNDVGYENVTWFNMESPDFNGETASKYGGLANAPRVIQILLNSGTGSARMTVIQNANVPL